MLSKSIVILDKSSPNSVRLSPPVSINIKPIMLEAQFTVEFIAFGSRIMVKTYIFVTRPAFEMLLSESSCDRMCSSVSSDALRLFLSIKKDKVIISRSKSEGFLQTSPSVWEIQACLLTFTTVRILNISISHQKTANCCMKSEHYQGLMLMNYSRDRGGQQQHFNVFTHSSLCRNNSTL